MTWFVYSLVAAVLWGGSYVLYEQIMKTMSAASAMFYTAFGTVFFYLVVSVFDKTLLPDWQTVKSGGRETWMIAGVIVVNALANLLLLVSMKMKNATLSGLIEISYPLFTALFAWLFLKEAQLSPGTFAGALLIFAGVACIYYFSRGVA